MPEPSLRPAISADAGAPLLELREVSRTYDGAVPVTALHPTDLLVYGGDLVAVTGPSGAGKSTLMNLLGLLDRPTAGSYRIAGTDTNGRTEGELASLRGRAFGFIFQQFHLLRERTALENVAMGMLYQGLPRRLRIERARDALVRVGLGARLDAFPSTLSGGECQRVAIARAVAASPAVLLCDEPTGNLDEATSHDVIALLLDLGRGGLTVIVVTHDRAVAGRMHRQITVTDGRVAEHLAPA